MQYIHLSLMLYLLEYSQMHRTRCSDPPLPLLLLHLGVSMEHHLMVIAIRKNIVNVGRTTLLFTRLQHLQQILDPGLQHLDVRDVDGSIFGWQDLFFPKYYELFPHTISRTMPRSLVRHRRQREMVLRRKSWKIRTRAPQKRLKCFPTTCRLRIHKVRVFAH